MSTFFLIFIPRLGSPLSCWLRPDYSWHFVTSEETFLASDVSHHEENSFWNYFLNNKHNTCRPANILHLVPFASFLFSSISHETRIYKFIRRRFMAAHSPDCHIMNLSCVNGKRTSCLFDFSRFRKKTVPIVRLSIPYECRPDIRNTTCKHTWMKKKKKVHTQQRHRQKTKISSFSFDDFMRLSRGKFSETPPTWLIVGRQLNWYAFPSASRQFSRDAYANESFINK